MKRMQQENDLKEFFTEYREKDNDLEIPEFQEFNPKSTDYGKRFIWIAVAASVVLLFIIFTIPQDSEKQIIPVVAVHQEYDAVEPTAPLMKEQDDILSWEAETDFLLKE